MTTESISMEAFAQKVNGKNRDEKVIGELHRCLNYLEEQVKTLPRRNKQGMTPHLERMRELIKEL